MRESVGGGRDVMFGGGDAPQGTDEIRTLMLDSEDSLSDLFGDAFPHTEEARRPSRLYSVRGSFWA